MRETMNRPRTWPGLSLAGALSLAGCSHEQNRPVATAAPAPSTSSTPAAELGTTTTTGARVQGDGGLSVSHSLADACRIEFDNAAAAPKFDFDRSDLSDQDRRVLQQVATCVTTGPMAGRRLSLVGHTDPRGEQEYNLTLGAHRSSSAAMYLEQLGVSPSNVSETSRGKLDATGTDAPTWAQDRRVDIDLK